MSTHIAAKEGQIADSVLLPGDPLRAKFIAENFLKDAECYTSVRNMFGYTGTYNGKRVSVQGTGMGQPSLSIYVNELFQFYNVQKAVRIGTCGAVQDNVNVRDIVIGLGACTDSSLINQRFGSLHFAPTPDWSLLRRAVEVAEAKGYNPHVGTIVSSDLFYDENDNWKLWAKYGALAIEMEAAELYTLAKKYNRKALAVLTVSDHIVKHQETTAEERQTSFTRMVEVALDTVTSV
jgi:purine-nucleoside phosphorylase